MSSGILATPIQIEHDGETTTEPLWRALQIVKMADRQAAIVDALPRDVALRALVALHAEGPSLGLRVPSRSRLLEEIGPEAREWAIAQADAFPIGRPDPQAFLKAYIFRALVRSHVPIEARWEHLYPHVVGASLDLLIECARGLPDARRAAVLASHFSSMGHAPQVVAAIPTADMVSALLGSVNPSLPQFGVYLASMQWLGKKNDVVRDAVDAFLAAMPKPLDLRVTSIVKPQSADELSPIAKEQLRIAGRGYDQQDLDAAARLEKNGEETSFHGQFELRTIADANGNPAYDMLLYMADAGSIFDADTTNEIGGLSQGGVVLAKENEPLRAALQAAVLAKTAVKTARKKAAKKKPK